MVHLSKLVSHLFLKLLLLSEEQTLTLTFVSLRWAHLMVKRLNQQVQQANIERRI